MSLLLDGLPMADDHSTIYVALLDEGTPCWRPVDAERIAGGVYRIVSENPDSEDEQWEFPSGSIVRCELRPLSDGEYIVAVSLVEEAV